MTQEKFQEFVIESLKSIDSRLRNVENDMSNMKVDIGWIKGKMEGRTEGRGWILSIFSVCTAIAAAIIALIALFGFVGCDDMQMQDGMHDLTGAPSGMVLIPAGEVTIGAPLGYSTLRVSSPAKINSKAHPQHTESRLSYYPSRLCC